MAAIIPAHAEHRPMIPFATWALKMTAAGSITVMGAVLTSLTVIAATDPTATAVGLLIGGGGFLAGVTKLLTDHRAIEQMRDTLESAALEARSERDRARSDRDRALGERDKMRIERDEHALELRAMRGDLAALQATVAALRGGGS